MNEKNDESPSTTLLDKLPRDLANKLDRFTELLKILLELNDENFEEKSRFLLNSDFYHLIDMYEMFITISLNVCFIWPKRIPIITKLFTIFHKKEKNSHSIATRQIIINQILHGYFNNPLDDVYVFQLYLILYGVQYHDITRAALVSDIKKCFLRKRQFANQLCMMSLYFTPEILAEDPEFCIELKHFAIKCKKKNLLSSKTLRFLDNVNYYRRNNWEMLIKNRNLFDCGDPKLRSFLFDDLELFKKTLNIKDDVNLDTSSDYKISAEFNEENNIINDMDIHLNNTNDNNNNFENNDFINDDSNNVNNSKDCANFDNSESNEMDVLCGYFENPPLSLFTLFDPKYPYISVAAGFRAEKIFTYLYKKGVPLNLPSETGATTVQLVSINPTEKILSILKEENCDLSEGMASFVRCFNIESFKRYCPLYLGRKYDEKFDADHPYSFKYVTSPTKSTVLVQSVLTTNFIALKMCLENQMIDINETDGFNVTPLDVACQMGNKFIVEILVELGADLNCGNPLINAAMCGHSEIVKYLLSLSPNNFNDEREDIHHEDDYLFRYNYHQCSNKNIKVPPNMINKENSNGITALYASIANSHYKVTRLLLMNKKTDLNKRFKDGQTYINIAASQNNIDILKIVLEYVQIPFEEHEVSPFISAIVSGMPDTFLYLLENKRDKIDLNKVIPSSDISAIWLAVKFSNPEIVSILIEKGKCNVTANEIDLVTRNNDNYMLNLLNKYYNIEDEDEEKNDDINNNNNADVNNENNNDDVVENEEESGTEAIADDFVPKGKSELF